jgi:hypothetical protein
MAGAYPVVPDIDPFTEYLPKECRYTPYNVEEAFRMVCHFLAKKEPFNLDTIRQFDVKHVVKQMVEIFRKALD